jgi:hypothetical protein
MVDFLYINAEQAEKEIRKTIPFIIASKNKMCRYKRNQGAREHYNENYKTFKKKIEEDPTR